LQDKLDAFQAAVILSLDTGRTEEAFRLVELARAGGWVPPPDEAATTVYADAEAQRLLAEVARLREVWHWRHSRLRQGGAGIEPPADQDPAREMPAWKELRAVERRLADAVRTLPLHRDQARSPLAFCTGQATQPASVSLASVALHLAEGQCLLAYYVVRGQVVAFVVHPAGYAIVSLPTTWAAVAQRLDRLRFSLHSQSSATLSHLQWLWQVLLAPLAPHLADCRQLMVVPHDSLHYLPFHALHDGTDYLLERYQVTYVPTVSLLMRPNPKATPPRSPLALILACSDHGRLPGTIAEGRAIHAAFASPSAASTPLLYLDAEATSARLRQHAPDCRLLHIAAHGRFRHDNPLFSALHLGDGPLLLVDLDDLRLPGTSLVVLSGCETGLGDLRGGDVLGLSRAFLHAGAKALLVSLWRVPDEATARLMEAFYQRLARGTPPAEALCEAQRELLVETEYTHPRQWAGWVLISSQWPAISVQLPTPS
jgi:CHAT domain-containing protein